MRSFVYLFIYLTTFLNIAYSQGVQTFSSSPAATITRDGNYHNFNLTVATSPAKTAMNSSWGLYRVKLNITHASKFNLSIQLVSPGGTTIQLFTRPSSPTAYDNFVETYFRDDAPMTLAAFLVPIVTYRRNTPASWIPENSFSTTINTGSTGSPDGTWTLKIKDGGSVSTGTLNSWEIEFRNTPNGDRTSSAWVTNSETGYPAYNDCATPRKMDKYYNYYGRTRLTYDENTSTDPPIGAGPWRLTEGDVNSTIDNTIWFTFKTDATGGTANVYISMINKYSGSGTGYQAVVLDPGASPCVAANWTRVAGSAYVGDNSLGSNPNPLSGPAAGSIMLYNSVLKCTGLAANKIYYVCVDGVTSSGGVATSDVDFQIEVTGNVLTNYVTLPVELIYFNGENSSDANILTWATASETNNAYFELEKSTDGTNFNTLTILNNQVAKIDSKKHQLTYQYQDVSCNAYYRLKQVDQDGTFKHFNTVFLEGDQEKTKPQIAPNPANNKLTISYYTKVNTPSTITIFDISGREIRQETTRFNSENKEIILDIENLQNGLYFIRVDNGFKSFQQKIVKE
ncbi:MAG: proprotein convertase P-domain-containing protein [Bacteroidetes bacterium]|nr:proprotein convertase P-domain-containing protein [Bacteroidota bacterium]